VCAAYVIILGLLLQGCSTFASYAGGAAYIAGQGGQATGVVVEASKGRGGEAGRSGVGFAESRARVLVAENHQQLASLVGGSHIGWLSPHVGVWQGLDVGLGAERTEGRAYVDAIAHLRRAQRTP
jgi:hypothetical protein